MQSPSCPWSSEPASSSYKDTLAVRNLYPDRQEQETVAERLSDSTDEASERTRHQTFALFLPTHCADLHTSFVTDPWVSYRNNGQRDAFDTPSFSIFLFS
ncbi:hypothetical protein I79_001013 [Cricetulus griseus]|uniref:Uncharacterized protein n=1 Tax=Cricetulus griseus TaxID=10029 RepID=G3GTM8_CRIGR|nr:hypothetical protein I79_001013 [Cricetulus griseus]